MRILTSVILLPLLLIAAGCAPPVESKVNREVKLLTVSACYPVQANLTGETCSDGEAPYWKRIHYAGDCSQPRCPMRNGFAVFSDGHFSFGPGGEGRPAVEGKLNREEWRRLTAATAATINAGLTAEAICVREPLTPGRAREVLSMTLRTAEKVELYSYSPTNNEKCSRANDEALKELRATVYEIANEHYRERHPRERLPRTI